MCFVGLDLIWPSSDGQNERDRLGRREVGQRCVPAGEGPGLVFFFVFCFIYLFFILRLLKGFLSFFPNLCRG